MKKRIWMPTLLAVIAGSSYLITTPQSLDYSASDHFDEDKQAFLIVKNLKRLSLFWMVYRSFGI